MKHAVLILAWALAAGSASAQSGSPTREQMLRQLTQPPVDAPEVDCSPGAPSAGSPACQREGRGWTLPGQRPSTPAANARPPQTTQRPSPPARPAGSAAAVPCAADQATAGGLNLCVTFALGSTQLTPASRQSLDTLASIMTRELATRSVVIEGHADAKGRADDNLVLSRRRAEAVVAYLTSKGVSPNRLRAEGYGAQRPIAGRAPTDAVNRRVEARLAS